MTEPAQPRRIDRLIWMTIAIVGATVLAAPLLSDFRIEWPAFALPAGAGIALAAGAWFYRNRRPDPRLAIALESTAQVIVFAAVGAPLSYLAASANLPLQDAALDRLDRAIAFDWNAMLAVMNAHPSLYNWLGLIYGSLTLQMAIAVLCLGFTARFAWLRIYTLSFVIAALTTIAISALLPAAGVWPHHGLSAPDPAHLIPAVKDSWPVFYGLRDGSYRSLVAVGSQGIITFPSLHAALAVILIIGLWPIARLRFVILPLNLAMLVATPIDGSHYLIDVIAGIVLAFVSVAVALRIAQWPEGEHARSHMRTTKNPRLAPSE